MAVTQVKTQDRDGYQALQLGVGESNGKNLSDAEKGHHEKAGGDSYFERLVEFRVSDPENFSLGQQVAVSGFSPGDTVSVTGVSKGKGFQGVVKWHGFAGGRRTHGGQKSAERGPGSIGATGPSHVRKGTKMAGRLGSDKTTVKNLTVIHTEPEDNELYIKGGLPGKDGSWLQITK
jgi:large subunit ribosomal protein L3